MSGTGGGGGTHVKSILKKGEISTGASGPTQSVEGAGGGGIQWDEMNIMMTEHPADKDYGHMKIDEPKTPYHEMANDEEEKEEEGSGNIIPDELADELARNLDQVGVTSRDVWERPGEGQEMEDEEAHLTQEQQEHKKKFKEWRKQHYDEFRKAKELLQQEEEDEEMQ